jgi:hypothetical protein
MYLWALLKIITIKPAYSWNIPKVNIFTQPNLYLLAYLIVEKFMYFIGSNQFK